MDYFGLVRAARRLVGAGCVAAALLLAACVSEEAGQPEAPHGRRLDYTAPYPNLGAFPPVPRASPPAERQRLLESLSGAESDGDVADAAKTSSIAAPRPRPRGSGGAAP